MSSMAQRCLSQVQDMQAQGNQTRANELVGVIDFKGEIYTRQERNQHGAEMFRYTSDYI